MSLATRCTECGTVFRVVQDQLKVSEGWVRCGRCSAVFNALENLCELDADATEPARVQSHEPAAQRMPAHALAEGGEQDDLHDHLHDHLHDLDDRLHGDRHAPTEPFVDTVAPHHEPGFDPDALPPMADDGLPAAIVSFSSESLPDDEPPLRAAPVAPAVAARPSAPAGPAAPQFVRAAERAAFWRRPGVRAGMAAAAVLLVATLLLQLAVAGRDWLAAHVTGTRPLLTAVCEVTGCRIEPLKRIAQLSVDSSGLTRMDNLAAYRLSVVLRNRAETAVAVPALDLSLTDGSGQLVARRVLRATELGLPPVIEAGQELPLQALLSTGERRVSGYTVELFYP
jgi:predicted Zn finger-like uncharacterized protein